VHRPEPNWSFESAPKIHPLSTQAMSHAQTEQRVELVLARVPITRVSDLTPLDPIGLPVFSATTPLARDLTTHMGKGLDPRGARLSAIMEAIERVSAERAPGVFITGSYDAMKTRYGGVVDPARFDLPSDSAYRPNRAIAWAVAHELLSDTPAWLPLDLAISPPRGEVLRAVDTNGLASGNSLLEAVTHGLCEVIERDAISQLEFVASFGQSDGASMGRLIDEKTVPEEARYWQARLLECGHVLLFEDVTTELAVATFRCTLIDDEFPLSANNPSGQATTRMSFLGYGTHPNAAVALSRSLTEAVQSRLGTIQGARDSFNTGPTNPRRAARGERVRAELRQRLRSRIGLAAFDDVPSTNHGDVRDDLRWLLERLRASGVDRVIAVDLTRAEFAVPVVRVRVAGLSSYLTNRRRVNQRCLRHLL
jgi:ribosomal protein S12 methylthiotransferase accessory factor